MKTWKMLDIKREIAKRTGVRQQDVEAVLRAYCDLIKDEVLVKGNHVMFAKCGKFVPHERLFSVNFGGDIRGMRVRRRMVKLNPAPRLQQKKAIEEG